MKKAISMRLGLAAFLFLAVLAGLWLVPRPPNRLEELRRHLDARSATIERPVLRGAPLHCDAGRELSSLATRVRDAETFDYGLEEAGLSMRAMWAASRDEITFMETSNVLWLAELARPLLERAAHCERLGLGRSDGAELGAKAALAAAFFESDDACAETATLTLRTAGDLMAMSEDVDSALRAEQLTSEALDMLDRCGGGSRAELEVLVATDPRVELLVERAAVTIATDLMHEIDIQCGWRKLGSEALDTLLAGDPRRAARNARITLVMRMEWGDAIEAATGLAEAARDGAPLDAPLRALQGTAYGAAREPNRMASLLMLDHENDRRLSAIARRAFF